MNEIINSIDTISELNLIRTLLDKREEEIRKSDNRALVDEIKDLPCSKTKFDDVIYDKVDGCVMIEKFMGVYWTFVFTEDRLLSELRAYGKTFRRTDSEKIGGYFGEDPNVCRFYYLRENEDLEIIVITHVFPESRIDRAVSGSYSDDNMESTKTIFWKKKL